jgi:hypothetical protein
VIATFGGDIDLFPEMTFPPLTSYWLGDRSLTFIEFGPPCDDRRILYAANRYERWLRYDHGVALALGLPWTAAQEFLPSVAFLPHRQGPRRCLRDRSLAVVVPGTWGACAAGFGPGPATNVGKDWTWDSS